MRNYEDHFRNKKVTIMGLGLLGRGIGDAVFLAECGADLTVTDMKDEKALAPSLEKLKDFPNIKYTLGRHEMEDFSSRGGQGKSDFILKAAGVPLDSPYIAHARKNGIPIEMDASLFVKLLPKGVTTIGVTGTRGKSTVTHLLSHILQNVGMTTYLGGNIRDMATLPLLKKVKKGDFIVLELDSWQLQGFGDAKISPHIAVFTNFMPDHLNYYKNDLDAYFEDKANIFRHQKKGDILVVGEDVESRIKNQESRKIIAKKENVPKDWKIQIPGEHNLANISCAIEACLAFGLSEDEIRKGVESFKGVEGRLQFVKEVHGVKIWNDNNSTTPQATVAALRALDELRITNYELKDHDSKFNIQDSKHIVLIIGGADKGLEVNELVEVINKTCKAVILLPGTGSRELATKLPSSLAPKLIEANNLDEAVKKAMEQAENGNIVLFSPAFASFGPPPGGFKNEYDRNDQFVKIVESL